MGKLMNICYLRNVILSFVIFLALSMTACSTINHVNLKIHTEPEGAHIVFRLDQSRWTYLGITPLETVEILDDSQIEGDHSFTLKAMRCGYLDQTKEWTGENLLLENSEVGMVLWTPRLIKNHE